MFKKLKDKLAEEVKSSPQRFQQIAQAAQAAVTSASSSISDITNNDMFTIGGDETPTSSPNKTPTASSGNNHLNSFQDVSLSQSPSPQLASRQLRESTPIDNTVDVAESTSNRTRKLSTSSMASDVSFRLPSYDSPQSIYHLQSDMDISASEAEDRGFSPGPTNLERISKEQLYQAYRRTQERYTKYRTRYADLARHYRLLERENSKARAVLVETQDKALRRISELREQCTLEQSAKAHLEHALRLELDEKSLQIEALSTKINLLQTRSDDNIDENLATNHEPKVEEKAVSKSDESPNLIDLSGESDNSNVEESATPAFQALNTKIEKLENLLAKYKESVKSFKDKNANLESEVKKKTVELEKSTKEVSKLKSETQQLQDTRKQIQELKESNKILENKLHEYQTNRDHQNSSHISDLEAATTQIQKLEKDIEIFKKREEENAFSLAENKLEIHKELETKEAEIKLLKKRIEDITNESKSHEETIHELQSKLKTIEEEKLESNSKLGNQENTQQVILNLEKKIDDLTKTISTKDQIISQKLEQYKCLELECKTEKAEKLAMIDRNKYLENRMQAIQEEISKKNKLIAKLEREIIEYTNKLEMHESARDNELAECRKKHSVLEQEIKEEREEFVKLRDEIEKMLQGSATLEKENENLRIMITETENKFKQVSNQKLHSEQLLLNHSKIFKHKLNLLKSELIQASECIKSMEKFFQSDVKNTFQKTVELIHIPVSCNNLSKQQIENDKSNEDISKKLQMEINILSDDKSQLVKTLEDASKALQQSKNENISLQSEIKLLQEKNNTQILELNNLKYQFESMNNDKFQLESKVNTLEDEKRSMQSKAESILEEVTALQKELNVVKLEHANLTAEKNNLESKISQMEEAENRKIEEVKNLRTECSSKSNELESLIENLQLEVVQLNEEKTKKVEELNNLSSKLQHNEKELSEKLSENSDLQEKLKKVTRECGRAKDKCELLKQEKEEMHEKCLAFEIKIAEAKRISEKADENDALISKVEELNKTLENLRLETQEDKNVIQSLEKIKLNLEEELAKIVQNKDYLQTKLDHIEEEKLELENQLVEFRKDRNNDLALITNMKTNLDTLKSELQDQSAKAAILQDKCKELDELQLEKEHLQEQLNNMTNIISKMELNHDAFEASYNALQEDNKILKKELEDLQTHIATISNENSNLNDKIRQLLANEEASKKVVRNLDAVPEDYEHLKETLHKNKEQIADLERQNSILVEEKLELEDQLRYLTRGNGNNSITTVTDVELELTRVREKNRELTEDKMLLESRLADLELMGRSGAENVRHLEINNEKLRLSKDKLEQRLDEALVSLRHARALEESTELEYLRNILYEYLTGPSSHSFTLAKVLAAVVKFDDRQTELVLQKEKERQGLFGQILQL